MVIVLYNKHFKCVILHSLYQHSGTFCMFIKIFLIVFVSYP